MKLQELRNQYLDKKIDKMTYVDLMHQKHQLLFEYMNFISDTEIESIAIDQNQIILTIRESGIKLLLDPKDKRFIPIEILNFGATEKDENVMIMKLIAHCKVAVDVGANIGWYSLNFGRLGHIDKVFAFEPISHTFSYLKKHLEINQIDKVEAFNIGLSDEKGQKDFFWTMEETGSSSMKNIRERSEISIEKCDIDTLDNFFNDIDIAVDFMKIDVEGAELLVINGGLSFIQKNNPIIFAELLRKWSAKFKYHPNDVISLLNKLGYNSYTASKGFFKRMQRVDDDTFETNFFFLHTDKHKSLIDQYCK